MAERRRIIEGTWKCGQCDTANIPGSAKVCPQCGSTREDDEAKFDFGERSASGASSAATVTDAAHLDLAAAGADWYCGNCGSANRGNSEKCIVCGNSDPDSRLAKKPEKPKQNQASAQPVAAPPAGGGGAKAAMGVVGCAVLGLFGTAIAAVLLMFALSMWKTEAGGTVARMHWERTITSETFTQVTGKTGWKGDLTVRPTKMPVNGSGEVIGTENLRSCVTLEKSPKKCETKTRKAACGTEEKCEVKDKGNGFAEEVCKDVTKYCDEKYEDCVESVIDDKCTYDTWEWKPGTPVKASGDDNAPKWPTAAAPGKLDRQVKTEVYNLSLAVGPDTYDYAPANEAEFVKFKPQQSVVVTTNALGAVTDVRAK